jgi:hypothetical protein
MSRLARIVFGVADLIGAGLLAFGVFAGLPARWWPVDTGAIVLATLQGVAGIGLLVDARWAPRAALASSATALLVGLGLILALALSASYLNGIYGPVGRRGAVIFVLVAALLAPYLVILPGVQLVWLGRRS